MSFTKIRPGGFGANTTLTSAEVQTLDVDHANALDKNGDTVGAAATITFPVGSTLTTNGVLNAVGAVNCYSTVTFGVGGAGDIVVTNLGSLTLNTGATCNINSLMSLRGAGSGITTFTGARVSLGDSDWVLLPNTHTGRTQRVLVPLNFGALYGTGWSIANNALGTGVTGPATTDHGTVLLPSLWNGALLNSVDLLFSTPTTHTTVPTNFPTLLFQSKTLNVGFSAPTGWTGASASVSYPAETVASYNNGGVKKITVLPALTIDRSNTQYSCLIGDENGGGALAGVVYLAVALNYTILDLRPE